MKRLLIIGCVIATAAALAAIAPAAAGRGTPAWLRVTPALDTGRGETLVVLVAGSYTTQAAADAANTRVHVGDMQGFVVARSDHFDAMTPGRWVLVTAFRTNEGADEFVLIANAAHLALRRIVTRYSGTAWIGLGQEANPDGSGPLVGPLPAPERLR